MNVERLTATAKAKIIEGIRGDISDLQNKIIGARMLQRNLYRGQIQSREAIIKRLEK